LPLSPSAKPETPDLLELIVTAQKDRAFSNCHPLRLSTYHAGWYDPLRVSQLGSATNAGFRSTHNSLIYEHPPPSSVRVLPVLKVLNQPAVVVGDALIYVRRASVFLWGTR